ncbi:uncharacterized protein [Diadema antillarum]|uniref:uncharacterized protein n=1 Tax=Diadema antillarum TaxID=105358 RepID=UPI003A89C6B6
MGCTYSRSEDLYKKSILNTEAFMGSVSDTPGYFSKTVHTLDFVESKFPNKMKTEMSYTGPPSHLQNSIDVHPFWSEFGREYVATDRYHDMTDGGVPRSLLPGTDTAQEMRNLEQKESMQDIRNQVRQKMAQARPIPEEQEDSGHQASASIDEENSNRLTSVSATPVMPTPLNSSKSPVESPTSGADMPRTVSPPPDSIDSEEKQALDFLDSIISESMDLDDDVKEAPARKVTEDGNWSMGSESFMKAEIRRRNLDKPVPGVMLERTQSEKQHHKANGDAPSRGGINVIRTSMYLPDANFMSPHSAAARANQHNSVMSYRVETEDLPNPLEMKHRNRYSTGYLLERNLSNRDSTASIDTGIFSDSSASNSASSNGSGVASRGHGVKNLVKIYNEQTRASTAEPAWKRQSAILPELEGIGPRPPPPPLRRSLSQQTSLPLDDSQRVPPNSQILEEIRAELQLSLSK